jgi:hypothetical protein
MSEAHERNVLTTYRSLRVAMIPLLLILVVAPGLETIRGQNCVLGSISAYFHTPVRGAFVFALAGLGVCLIAYKGNDSVEDVLLNFAGFMAFLVALVPTTVDTLCAEKYGNVVADANTALAVRNNVLTLLLISGVAIGLYRIMPKLVAAAKKRRGLTTVTMVSLTANDKNALTLARVLKNPLMLARSLKSALTLPRVVGAVALLIVLVELALFGFWPSTFKDKAHGISAITMVVGVLGVMVANARGFAGATRDINNPPPRHWNNRYAAAASVTIVLIVLAYRTIRRTQHLILAVELIVILGFVVFWYMQTRELWDYPTREQKSQEVDEVLEKAGREQKPQSQVVANESAPRPSPQVAAEEPAHLPQPEVFVPAKPATSRGDVYEAL